MVFKSSQNHVRPHILYIIGKRMTSAMTMTMTKTPTKTNTKTKTMTKTLCLKDISYAIFSKSRELEDIEYDTHTYTDQTRPDQTNRVECFPDLLGIFYSFNMKF